MHHQESPAEFTWLPAIPGNYHENVQCCQDNSWGLPISHLGSCARHNPFVWSLWPALASSIPSPGKSHMRIWHFWRHRDTYIHKDPRHKPKTGPRITIIFVMPIQTCVWSIVIFHFGCKGFVAFQMIEYKSSKTCWSIYNGIVNGLIPCLGSIVDAWQ